MSSPAAASAAAARRWFHAAPGQDVRRRVGGTWVHESCPA
jgi:hypothetical protein